MSDTANSQTQDDGTNTDDNKPQGDQQQQNNDIKNPEAHRASQEAANWRNKYRDLEQQLQQSNPELDELRRFKQEIDDRDKSELEKATGTLQTVTQERDQLKEVVQDLQLKVGILTAQDSGQFHNPLAALKFVPDYKPELGDDGRVTNLGDILTDIAKDHPYLLKEVSGDNEEDDGENENEEGDTSGAPSGSPFNKKKQSGQYDRGYLENKFPALRGR